LTPISITDIEEIQPGEERNFIEILLSSCRYAIFEISVGSDQIHSIRTALRNEVTCLFLWDQYQGKNPIIDADIRSSVSQTFVKSYAHTMQLDMVVGVFLSNSVKPSPTVSQSDGLLITKSPSVYLGKIEILYAIIRGIDGGGKEMENHPATFNSFNETQLRDIISVCLNSWQSGSASTETFSKKGKTDILLRVSSIPVLVIECKLWKGAVQFQNAIGQLLGYLTQRFSWGIIIVFSKNQEFTKVLQVIWDEIPKHTSFKFGLAKRDFSHFVSFNCLPTDSNKVVEIHYLNYDLSV
jgi:hypothetical protein